MDRLTVLYPVGTAVELYRDEWVRGEVIAHQHPAVWVRTADGRSWFITNRQRIRLMDGDEKQSNPD